MVGSERNRGPSESPSREEKALCLAPFRVLDLCDEKGFFCGKILADLGADVIKIERPGGDPARKIGPFYHDIPDPEKSLYWFAFNSSKRGITLNLETSDGQQIFKRLVRSADFVIESFAPGYMDRLGLGYSNLSDLNPRIILTSITPFGQTGPYKGYEGSDMVCMALSGYMNLCGYPDSAPVQISFPQAYLYGASQAAVGTLVAHYYRGMTGEGQHVDVSIQESAVPLTANAIPYWETSGVVLQRGGSHRVGISSGAMQRLIWPCSDGYVSFLVMADSAGRSSCRSLVEWMAQEGMVDDFLKQIDWDALDMRLTTQDWHHRVEEPIGRFFMTHTKAELYRGAIERRIMIYPVLTCGEITKNEQLEARGFWEQVDHPDLGSIFTYPGGFAKFSRALCGIRCRAPLIGEHNLDIYVKELGLSQRELILLKGANVI